MCNRCLENKSLAYVVHSDEMEIEVCKECGEEAMEEPCKISKPSDIPGKIFVNYIQ